jgi:error-prone DNA polymerase
VAAIERSDGCFCNVCSHQWTEAPAGRHRFASIDDLARSVGLRRDEITTLAEIGALNSFGMDRRSALWQVERVVRPAGELFEEAALGSQRSAFGDEVALAHDPFATTFRAASESRKPIAESQHASPLMPMTPSERLVADYSGTKLTIGPHPMSFKRHELSMRGVIRAIDLPNIPNGRRIRTAGMVITRQRPGTAKGFVFLTLEDETGVANIIVRPDFYDKERLTVVESPFLIVEGILQTVDGVTAIKAERVFRIEGLSPGSSIESHDFH